jgi:tetratricopeptide (TPR) repeat protein
MPSQDLKTCTSCGARLKPDAKVCSVCGTEVSHDEFLAAPDTSFKNEGASKKNSGLSAFQKGFSIALIAVCVIGGISFGIARYMMPDVQPAPPAGHGQEAAQMSEEEFKKQQEEMMAASHALLQNVKDSLSADPENPRLVLKLANLYYDIKNFKEAEPYYSQYLSKFGPKDQNARVDYGYVLFSNGKQQEGISQLKTVLKTDPNHAFALFNLGIMHYEMKNIPEARVWFQKCAEQSSDQRLKDMAQQILKDLETQKNL